MKAEESMVEFVQNSLDLRIKKSGYDIWEISNRRVLGGRPIHTVAISSRKFKQLINELTAILENEEC